MVSKLYFLLNDVTLYLHKILLQTTQMQSGPILICSRNLSIDFWLGLEFVCLHLTEVYKLPELNISFLLHLDLHFLKTSRFHLNIFLLKIVQRLYLIGSLTNCSVETLINCNSCGFSLILSAE